MITYSILTKLVLADVGQFLGRRQLDSSTALIVRLCLATFKWLEGCVIYELCLLYDVEVHVCALVGHLAYFAPVQEVVIVDHAAAEVTLAEH